MSKQIRKIDTYLGVPNFVRLFPPPAKGTYIYFNGADEFPFKADATGHSPQNAWWLAEYSLLTYCEKEEVNKILAEIFPDQIVNFVWLESNKTNTQGFIVEMPEFIAIVFRGTEFPRPSTVLKSPSEIRDIIEDIKTDIQQVNPETITKGMPTFDIPVHPGFATALQSIWPQLQTALSDKVNKPIWLCGHSLGGAIATLLAFQIPERIAGLYTFGSPCAGASEFVKAFQVNKGLAERTYRYVHGTDAVANALPLLGRGYQHVGQLKQLDAGMRRGLFAQLANLAIAHTIRLNQFDHAPIIYSYECWNAISG